MMEISIKKANMLHCLIYLFSTLTEVTCQSDVPRLSVVQSTEGAFRWTIDPLEDVVVDGDVVDVVEIDVDVDVGVDVDVDVDVVPVHFVLQFFKCFLKFYIDVGSLDWK